MACRGGKNYLALLGQQELARRAFDNEGLAPEEVLLVKLLNLNLLNCLFAHPGQSVRGSQHPPEGDVAGEQKRQAKHQLLPELHGVDHNGVGHPF